jgi:hypothetical protein
MSWSWSSESHLIQPGRVAIGRASARATAPRDISTRPAVTSSQESIATSPGTGATRSGSPRPVAKVLRSTTLIRRGGLTSDSGLDRRVCVQKVRKTDDVVKQSPSSCQSSLHLDSCSFSNLMSRCGALNCTDATRLTLCPARVVSLSCPLFIRSASPVPGGSRRCGADARERLTRSMGSTCSNTTG